jgi:uncharacterized membrane protein YdjX (TVP38/TMEM64 family)
MAGSAIETTMAESADAPTKQWRCVACTKNVVTRAREFWTRMTWTQRALVLFLAAVLAAGFITLATGDLIDAANATLDALDSIHLAALLLILVVLYVGLVAIGIPNLVLCIGTATLIARRLHARDNAGAFAGSLAISCAIASIGLVTGGSLSYLLGRTVLRSWALQLRESSRIYRALDGALEKDGAKVSALMRTSLPLVLVNYGMALSKCPFRKFLLGMLGHAPWVIVYAWLGCTLDSVADILSGSGGGGTARTWAGLGALVVTGVVLTYVTQRALRKIVAESATPALEREPDAAAADVESGAARAASVEAASPEQRIEASSV